MKIAIFHRTLAACLVAMFCMVSSITTASDMVLVIDGIKGESEVKPNGIDVYGYSHDILPEVTTKGKTGAAAVKKVTLSDVSFTTRMSQATPQLMLACATGKHIPKAILTANRNYPTVDEGSDFLVVTLEDCLISSYKSTNDTWEESPSDEFSIAFRKITVSVRPMAGGDPFIFSYDVSNGKVK